MVQCSLPLLSRMLRTLNAGQALIVSVTELNDFAILPVHNSF